MEVLPIAVNACPEGFEGNVLPRQHAREAEMEDYNTIPMNIEIHIREYRTTRKSIFSLRNLIAIYHLF
jgi:hypothetical protein